MYATRIFWYLQNVVFSFRNVICSTTATYPSNVFGLIT